jgi:hypothetical protein
MITAEEVVARLTEAAYTMRALSVRGVKPAGYGNGWPDVVRDFAEAYGYTDEPIRMHQPNAAQVTLMEEAMAWLRFIPQDQAVLRRIVWARCVRHPVSGAWLFSWRRIAQMVGSDRVSVQRWHGYGVAIMVAGINGETWGVPRNARIATASVDTRAAFVA